MQKTFALLAILLLTGLVAASCGGGNGGEEDTTIDDVTTDDQTDQTTDTPGDRPPDTPADNPTDTPAEENPGEVVPDGQPDVTPDTEPDAEPDGELPLSQCVENGGYCTTYPIIPDPCVLCPDVGEDHYKPSRPTDDAMGCTVEGEGAGPWCCVLANVGDPSPCESGGGECYPGGGDCPLGWVENPDLDCNGSQRCCAPGPACTTP